MYSAPQCSQSGFYIGDESRISTKQYPKIKRYNLKTVFNQLVWFKVGVVYDVIGTI